MLRRSLAVLLLLSGCAIGCSDPEPSSTSAQEAVDEPFGGDEDTGGAVTEEPEAAVERLFLYELSLGAPEGCESSGESRPMRVRGYQLAFVGQSEEHGGPTATLLAIRGDGTVPGVMHEANATCLESLDESFGARGYERTTIHVEAVDGGRGGPTVPAVAYVIPRGASTAAPAEPYAAALRAAWEEAGLDTGALDHALQNP